METAVLIRRDQTTQAERHSARFKNQVDEGQAVKQAFSYEVRIFGEVRNES